MIAIRRIYDHNNPVNQMAIVQCKAILVAQFPHLSPAEADEIFIAAKNPLATRFRYVVLVAEARNKKVLGVVIASYFPKEKFYFLDYIAAHQHRSGGGVGGALYERLREEAAAANAIGIFFDCLPDGPELCPDEKERKQNIARLRFYERYGARPIEGTLYELPRSDRSVFHLVFEGPGEKPGLKASDGRKIIKAILENKHSAKCPPEYIRKVVGSIMGNTLLLRAKKHLRKEKYIEIKREIPSDKKIGLVVNEGHIIHHVKDKGYLESPVRVKSILKEIDKVKIFEKMPAKNHPDSWVEEVHDPLFVQFLKNVCAAAKDDAIFYPEIFPKRFSERIPLRPEHQIGYYCIDSTTPLHANAYKASRAAVNCALTAANQVLNGRQMAYALVRPPGHHAERKYFGGFCYLNSNAVAANYLSKKGKVAILDIDYHHGNGQQNIFYERNDVLTISIHGDPVYAYPNFTGFADETGKGEGEGFNLNIPLKKGTDGKTYRKALGLAIDKIQAFGPTYLVIALGLDTAQGDPTGTWMLSSNDFVENGKRLAHLNLPTLIVQEGGYKNRDLGINARHFFEGLWEGYYR
ncbi:MAG: histone deacetylase family protein [Cyclobacteriaceae bacterium]|nr:histone deacetylase family protein [Cyclobacteriaceae bacterium]MCB0500306.1 histone deacetylase family protein [Cyclobacteriaceae bacterium]MCB9237523.1 histone deacetylase family protein [Flammeovirgaceae bacterium]MCO5270374.1 histone deacetylase family protein [Cyclobacteriaceae bacterium]MCW5903545.1 histone deacetylase family protein [Cyclobacteriaceae bacterium]